MKTDRIDEMSKELDVSLAFIKAAQEVKTEKLERDKRNKEQAVKAAEQRCRQKYEREAYEKWRMENPLTDEERKENKHKLNILLGKEDKSDE